MRGNFTSVGLVPGLPALCSHPTLRAAHVAITDTGTGIASDQLERIFEPFYTAKGVGTGPGWASAKCSGSPNNPWATWPLEAWSDRAPPLPLYLPLATDIVPQHDGNRSSVEPLNVDARILLVVDNKDVGVNTQMMEQLVRHLILL